MRKIVSSLFISLDGVTQDPYKWQFDCWNNHMEAAMEALIASQDAVLLGRVTYQEWASYWPTSPHEPFATFINNTPKYVVSTTLNKTEWQNSTLLKGNFVEELTEMKQQPGKNIGVTGSSTLVQFLLQNDLLDELILSVHPVVVGSGNRLFTDGNSLKRLKLVSTKTTGAGVVILTYQPYEKV